MPIRVLSVISRDLGSMGFKVEQVHFSVGQMKNHRWRLLIGWNIGLASLRNGLVL